VHLDVQVGGGRGQPFEVRWPRVTGAVELLTAAGASLIGEAAQNGRPGRQRVLRPVTWQGVGVATISLSAQLLRTRRFASGVPHQFTVALDGAAVLFLRSRAGDDPVTCLWVLDLDSGTERLLADPAELVGTCAHPGIGAYATDRAAGMVAFALADELWTVDVSGGRARRLPAEGPVVDPRPDPTGRRIGYVCNGALRVIEADGTGDRTIAAPDGPDVTFGIAELTGIASPGGPRGYWWSPDGARLLVARVDSAAVELWHTADPAEPAKVARAVRYAAAGKANADVSLWIAGLGGARTEARWDRRAFEYVPGAGWDVHGPYAVVQSRNQRTVRFLGIDPVGGETRVLSEQRDECWVQLVPGLPARTGSGALVAHADLQGTRHLTVSGVAVTPPGLQLRAVLGVDGDEVLFTASEEPTETHLWSYRPADGIRRLSDEPGVHSGVGRGETLVHVAADRSGGRIVVLRQGKPAVPVLSLVEQPVIDVRATRLVLGPRELRAELYRPSWHRPDSGPLPVLVDPYGGAGRQRVTAELDWRCLVSQWFAEQGFAVLVADGAGTPGRGPDWEREVHGDLFGPVLDDQVAAVQEAGRVHPELDLGRVGIRGWSFGGSLAALAVLRRPDVFHAAVAGAGVTDQLLYNAHWRERFLGHPDEFPERYEACSLVLDAPKLTRPLLLMHGLADENVFPANTLRLSSALLAAGRHHEVLLLPGVGHQAMGVAITENLLWHQVRFLQRNLGVEPVARQGVAPPMCA
jgi:dipeptidyl-peptidase-4